MCVRGYVCVCERGTWTTAWHAWMRRGYATTAAAGPRCGWHVTAKARAGHDARPQAGTWMAPAIAHLPFKGGTAVA